MNAASVKIDVLAQQEANLRGAQSESVHSGKQRQIALVCDLGKEPLNLSTSQRHILRPGLLPPGFRLAQCGVFLA